MATLLPEGKQSFTNSAGVPLVGGKLYTYDAGTATPRTTYQDSAGTTPNANPVILDARGEATVFWSGAYKVVLKDAADVTIWSVDNVISDSGADQLRTDLAASTGSTLVGFIRSAAGAIATTVSKWVNRRNPSVFDFMTDAQVTDVQSRAAAIDITAAITAAINSLSAGGGTIFCPAGTYNFPAALATIASKSGIRFKGAGRGATVFKSTVPVGTPTFGNPVFMLFTSCTNITIEDISFDVNSILTTATNTSVLGFSLGSDVTIQRCEILRGVRLGFAFNGTSRWRVQDCYMSRAGGALGTYQNEAILSTVSAGAVEKGFAVNNVLDGWGMLLSGNDLRVIGNTVDSWGYGGGITINADASTLRAVVLGNTCKNSTGIDVNATQPSGIECWAPYSVIEGNVCHTNAGSGISFGGRYSVVTGNSCINNGSYNNTGTGIGAVWQTGWTPASDSIVSNNEMGDTGTGFQKYGYGENQSAGATFSNMQIRNNQIFGNTTAETLYSPTSTQTQFTGRVFENSAVYDAPSIAVGSTDIGLVIVVAGAQTGDFVEISGGGNMSGLTAYGNITSTNNVQVLLFNGYTGAVNLPSMTFRARVHQRR